MQFSSLSPNQERITDIQSTTAPLHYYPPSQKSLNPLFLRNLTLRLVLKSEQFACRPQHSTTHQLVGLVDQLAANSNSKLCTATVFLDVEKALDRVWHAGLLYKLHTLGTSTLLLNIINSFLTDRTFSIEAKTADRSCREPWSRFSG